MTNNAESDALTDVLRTLLYGAWQDGITSEEDTDSLAEWLAPRLASYVTTPAEHLPTENSGECSICLAPWPCSYVTTPAETDGDCGHHPEWFTDKDECRHPKCIAPRHVLTEYGTTTCPVERVRAEVDDGVCSACGGSVTPPVRTNP